MKWYLPLLLLLVACATSDQNLPNRQNLGEGNKDMTAAMFDSVATTRQQAKLKDGQDARGGAFSEPVTATVEETIDYEVKVPVIDVQGNAVLDEQGDPVFDIEIRQKTVKRVVAVLGPDGKPLYRSATGFRNLVINYGSITQTLTSSGETQGANTSGQQPVSTPTNTPSVDVSIPTR